MRKGSLRLFRKIRTHRQLDIAHMEDMTRIDMSGNRFLPNGYLLYVAHLRPYPLWRSSRQ